MTERSAPTIPPGDFHAVADLHHRFLTGLILGLVLRAGEDTAAEAMYRVFRRQHEEKFLPGLKLLGLDGLPDAVASAQYHYLSNFIGTVKVTYMPETDRKAWVRYPPPRWIFDGTAVCGVPDSVTVAMMRGWHANNGPALGNPRLRFVCTGMTTAGDAGLEGYFEETDAPLRPEERLHFAPQEQAPPFDPAAAPAVDYSAWPADRLAKAERNYAVDFVRVMLSELAGLLDEDRMHAIAGLAARQVGMQYYDASRAILDLSGDGLAAFGDYMERMSRAMGDDPVRAETGAGATLSVPNLKLLNELDDPPAIVFEVWNGLWEGACASHDVRLNLTAERQSDGGVAWRIA